MFPIDSVVRNEANLRGMTEPLSEEGNIPTERRAKKPVPSQGITSRPAEEDGSVDPLIMMPKRALPPVPSALPA